MVLRPWQHAMLHDLFKQRVDGLRQHRRALIGLPRKNAKSTICSGLALYLLIGDREPGAEVYSCAGDRDQARIVFGEAKRMVEQDPDLSGRLKQYRDVIEDPKTGSVYRVLSADAPTKQGLKPSAVIFDELHVQPDRELWDAMTMGSGTRRQPLIVAISTAGYDLEGTICGELYRYGRSIERGETSDPSFYFHWWEPRDPNADWRDPAIWAEANPALGDFLAIESLQEDLNKPEHVFRRYHLNQWTATETAWLPYGSWDACKSDLELDQSLPLWVGIDVALRNDSTAVVAAQRQEGRTVVRARIWQNPYPEGHSLRDGWELPIFEVEDHLRDLRERFPQPACTIDDEVRPGPEFAYDPTFFHRSARLLEGDGLAMVKIVQHDSNMIPASQTLYQLVVERTLAHNGDPIMAEHVRNAVAEQKERGWRLTRPKGSRRKIDAAIACAIAGWRAQMKPPQAFRSVYEDGELLVVG